MTEVRDAAGTLPVREDLDEKILDLPDRLMDLLPGAFYLCDSDGRIIRYNRSAAELWGRHPRLGDPEERYCGSLRLYRLDGGPLPHGECPMAQVLRDGVPVRNQEVVIERPDGSRIVALVNIDALKDRSGRIVGAANCFRDITEHWRRRQQQRETEEQARTLLDSVPAAIYTTDAEGRITFYNEAAATLWGCRPTLGKAEFCGSWKLYTPDGRPLRHEDCPMALALKERRPIRGVEAVAERPDGTRVPFLPFPTPLFDSEGRLTGAVNLLVDISQRKGMEARLSDSETRYRRIFENAKVALWEEDFSAAAAWLDLRRAEGVTDLRAYFEANPARLAEVLELVRILDVNPAAVELLEAASREDLMGSLADIFLPETMPSFVEELVALWEGRSHLASETVLRTRKGRVIDLAFTLAFGNERGERTLVSILDISARKAAERALLKQTKQLETVNRLARVLSRDFDLERIVQTVTDAATEVSGAQFGAFFYSVTDGGDERYKLHSLSGMPREAFETFSLPRTMPLFATTFRGLGVLRADDVRQDPRFGKNPLHHGLPKGHLPVASYLAVPVVSRSGEVHGGLFLGHEQPGVFTEITEEIVPAMAAHAAVAIDNARLFQATQRLAAIVESSDDAILSLDLEGRITSWNRAAMRLYGYQPQEAIGQPIALLVPAERHTEETVILERIRRGDHIDHYETVRRRKDGSLVEISLTVSPIRDALGRIVGASKIARDITERRRAQERQSLLLREMNHRVKNLFALAGSVISLSARAAGSPQEMGAAVRDRLAALARAHALTLPDSLEGKDKADQPTTLHTLLRTIVLPYDAPPDGTPGSEARVTLTGADLPVAGSAVTSLALLLHEFATNAAKYGALSTPQGRIAVESRCEREQLVLTWRERGGPPLSGPAREEGFGTLLARVTVQGQLGGQILRDWQPDGLEIRLSAPLQRLAS